MKNPYLNAVLAAVYIVLIVLVIHGFAIVGEDKEDTIIIPMTMLSLLVLSVSVMGGLFALQPLRMYLDGQKQEAVKFFTRTVATFACMAVIFVLIMIYTI